MTHGIHPPELPPDTAIIPGLPEPVDFTPDETPGEPLDEARILEAIRFSPNKAGLSREDRITALAQAQRVVVESTSGGTAQCVLVPDELAQWAASEIRSLDDQLERLCIDLGVRRGDIA
jgi:hypothetical protein